MTLGEAAAPPAAGSLDQFIAEHYWGYSAPRENVAVEYQVAHPPWRVCPATRCRFDGDAGQLYGDRFAGPLSVEPASAFWADGSAVRVDRGRRIGRPPLNS